MKEYGIQVVPLNFYAGGKLYRDGVDVTPTQAYELFLQDPDSFKTSAASPDEFLQTYQRAAERSRHILCVMLSSGISGTCNIARTTAGIFTTSEPNIDIQVMDSRTATSAEGMIVLAAAEAARQGQTFEEVIAAAEKVKEQVRAVVLLDTIKYVYRSGRIPQIASRIGTALNIKPIFTVRNTVRFNGVVRSAKQGTDRILRMMRDEVGKNAVNVAVMHVYAPAEAERLKERIAAEFNCADLWLTEFSPIMGYACGTGALGISFCPA